MFHLPGIDSATLRDLSNHYEERGFCVLTGLEETVSDCFYPRIRQLLGATEPEFRDILAARGDHYMFPIEVRAKLAQVTSDPELAGALIRVLKPVLRTILGPIVHVSSTFHTQFKSGSTAPVDHGGYQSGLKYLEVHGAYLLHQDFTGATIPTSPSAMTLWVGLNDTPDWKLRLYPGSHRMGLLCNQWLPLDHPGVSALNEPVDIEARKGTAVIFNSLLLHGTGPGGPLRRVSCDIRFFPACAFLPTTPHLLTSEPLQAIEEALAEHPGPVRTAPLWEDLVLSGLRNDPITAPPLSILNWVNCLQAIRDGKPDQAMSHLTRFTNQEVGIDPPEVYAAKFLHRPMHSETLQTIREKLSSEAVRVGS